MSEETYQRSLVIRNMDHFQKAINFSYDMAKKGEIKKEWLSLENRIMYLLTGDYGQCEELVLMPDFVPHSFYFELRKEGKRWMNGGIILHGLKDVSTFSVEIDSPDGLHWSIHT